MKCSWRVYGAISLLGACCLVGSACGGDPKDVWRPSNGGGGGTVQPEDAGDGDVGSSEPGPNRKPTSRHEVEIIPGPADAAPDAPGVIRGVVLFEGEPPARKVIKIAGGGCQHEGDPQLKEDLIVTDGRVALAYVYVSKGLAEEERPVPEEPVYLDQVGCMYSPHVICVQLGQKLLVRNSDTTLHNVNWPGGNKMQPAGSKPLEVVYDRPGVGVFYRCDIHPWMSAFVCVADHPFQQVTGEDGAFSLPEIPPGPYELVLWTEKFTNDRGLPAFEVPPGGEVVVTFRLSADSGRRRRRGR